MLASILGFLRLSLQSLRDLAPIILVILVFQVAVLQQPFPILAETLIGLLFVTLGLTLIIGGLDMGVFPLGETMAESFARKGVLIWLLAFALALGFGTTVAGPTLITVADEAARVAAKAGVIATAEAARDSSAFDLLNGVVA